jgi:hypothetical protein
MRRVDVGCLGLVALAGVALWYLRILLPIPMPQSVGARNADLYTLYYPLYSFAYRGTELLPFWNPFQIAGTPTVGYLAGGLYYPPNLVCALLPVRLALGVLAAMHIALAGVGAAMLARSVGLSRLAAVVAGVGFLSNVFFVDEHLRPQYLAGLGWIPFVALGLRRLLQAPSVVRAVTLGVVVALQLATGHAQIVCYEAYGAAAFVVAASTIALARGDPRRAGAVVTAALGAGLVALLVAAAQVMPTVEVMSQAVRGFGGLTLAQTLPPLPTWGLFRSVATSSGTIVLLAPLALLVDREARTTVAVIAIVAATATAIGGGTALYTKVFYELPGVALFRLPQQLLVVAALGACVLAGFGVDALGMQSSRTAGVGVGVAAVVAGVLVREELGAPWIAALAACSLVVGFSPGARRAALLALVLVVTAERFAHTSNTTMIPAANDAAFFAEPKFVGYLRNAAGFDRVLAIKNWNRRFPIMEKMGSLYGFSVVQDYEPLTPQAYHDLLRDLEGNNPDAPLFWGRFVAHPVDDGWRALDLLSTRWVVTAPDVGWIPRSLSRFRAVYRDDDAIVFENRHPLPRAAVVDAYRVVGDQADAVRTILDPRFDPRAEVLLDREPVRPTAAETADTAPTAAIVSRTATTVTIRATTPGRAFVVLNDFFWPGWTATVDETATPIYRANGLFRAVDVPPGSHTVVFSYRSWSIRIGLLVSVASIACCAALVLRGRRRASPARMG